MTDTADSYTNMVDSIFFSSFPPFTYIFMVPGLRNICVALYFSFYMYILGLNNHKHICDNDHNTLHLYVALKLTLLHSVLAVCAKYMSVTL